MDEEDGPTKQDTGYFPMSIDNGGLTDAIGGPTDAMALEDFDEDNNGMVISSRDTINNCQSQTKAPPPKGPPFDLGASFLIIVFFFFQDSQLLHITTAFTKKDNHAMAVFKEILSGLFKFRIEFVHFIDKMCFLHGLNATEKLLVRVLVVPYVLLQFAIVYLIYRYMKLNCLELSNLITIAY